MKNSRLAWSIFALFLLVDLAIGGWMITATPPQKVKIQRAWAELNTAIHANLGNVDAQKTFGDMYILGTGVKQNPLKGIGWLKKAAEGGNNEAAHTVGLFYARGEYVEKNFAEAKKWFELAANRGNAVAQFDLGIMYEKGDGVSKDSAKAAEWYRKAANQKHRRSEFLLAEIYRLGTGGAQNFSEAATWYRKAADQGDLGAKYELGLMYAQGQGVKQDYSEAVTLLRDPATHGDVHAQKLLDLCEKLEKGAQIPVSEVAISTGLNDFKNQKVINRSASDLGLNVPPQPNQIPNDSSGTLAPTVSKDYFLRELDSLYARQDWNGLGNALLRVTDEQMLKQSMEWLEKRINEGAGFFLAFIYHLDLWSVGVKQNISAPERDMRVRAGSMLLYAFAIINIDGAKCEDFTAPGHRAEQLIMKSPSVLKFAKGLPANIKTKMADDAIALEKKTASLRNDDLVCRDGMAQLKAGIEGGKQFEVPSGPGQFRGKQILVEAPPGWKPKFFSPEKYVPEQEKDRAMMKQILMYIIQ